MTDDPHAELAAAIGRIAARIAADPDVRAALRAIAAIVREVVAPAAATEPVAAEGSPVAPVAAPPPPERPDAPVDGENKPGPAAPPAPAPPVERGPREPRIPLTLGQGRPTAVASPPAEPPPKRAEAEDDEDLETIARRCRLKAEGVRWAVERQRRIDRGADFREEVAPKDRDIHDRARALPRCPLWMNLPQGGAAVAADPRGAEDLALAFEAAAAVADLLRDLEDDLDDGAGSGLLAEALALAAEAQSALRTANLHLGGPRDDDQAALFGWVHRLARDRVYIRRYMRTDDPAEPAGVPLLLRRVADLGAELAEARDRERRRRKRLGQARYLAGRLRDGQASEEDWTKLAQAADALVVDGLPPSSPELRDLLLPLLDDLPDHAPWPRGFDLAIDAAERHRATTPTPPDEGAPAEPSPAIREVARLLRGRHVVFICNVSNPPARDALIRAFDLADIDWIVTREHQSISAIEPHIARPEVALVLLPIRWSSHSFGDIRHFCDRYGKALVRLKAGYNPNQVATQILDQCSEQLARAAGE